MVQVVVYGHRASLDRRRTALSDAIHEAVVDALEYPREKRFQRFIGLEDDDFLHPADRGPDYTIIEISMLAGRSTAARRRLIAALFDRIETSVGTDPHSVEITLTETPAENWGIRGMNGADLALGYELDP